MFDEGRRVGGDVESGTAAATGRRTGLVSAHAFDEDMRRERARDGQGPGEKRERGAVAATVRDRSGRVLEEAELEEARKVGPLLLI